MPATTLEIHSRSLVLDGRPFGTAGAYEKIAGVLRFAADPHHPLHASICDLGAVPLNRQGRVEFAGDFYVLQPVDPARGSRRLLLDVPNRGRKVALGMFNSTPRWMLDEDVEASVARAGQMWDLFQEGLA